MVFGVYLLIRKLCGSPLPPSHKAMARQVRLLAVCVGHLTDMWVLYHILGQKSNEIEINVREMILVSFINPKSEYRNPKQI
jgi:hypothetical protein